MLSEVARLFDPLGWLALVISAAKILIQRLWINKVDLDQPVDDQTLTAWLQLRRELPKLEELQISRWLGTFSTSRFTLHGFADASHAAYAAVVYLVVTEEGRVPSATILTAKTKLAPIKTVSIPRLELCAALLLTRLLKQVTEQFQLQPDAIYCWSDSKVALSWLADHPSRWTTFVANRVIEILTSLLQARWSHVRSAENPADVASHGSLHSKLRNHHLWWQGPAWLTMGSKKWPSPTGSLSTDLEQRQAVLTFATRNESSETPSEALLLRFSNLTRLIRFVSYVCRWKQLSSPQGSTKPRQSTVLSAEELRQTRITLIRAV